MLHKLRQKYFCICSIYISCPFRKQKTNLRIVIENNVLHNTFLNCWKNKQYFQLWHVFTFSDWDFHRLLFIILDTRRRSLECAERLVELRFHFAWSSGRASPNIARHTSPSVSPPACCALITPTPTHAHGQSFEKPLDIRQHGHTLTFRNHRPTQSQQIHLTCASTPHKCTYAFL